MPKVENCRATFHTLSCSWYDTGQLQTTFSASLVTLSLLSLKDFVYCFPLCSQYGMHGSIQGWRETAVNSFTSQARSTNFSLPWGPTFLRMSRYLSSANSSLPGVRQVVCARLLIDATSLAAVQILMQHMYISHYDMEKSWYQCSCDWFAQGAAWSQQVHLWLDQQYGTEESEQSLYRKQKKQAMKVLNRHPACNSKGVNWFQSIWMVSMFFAFDGEFMPFSLMCLAPVGTADFHLFVGVWRAPGCFELWPNWLNWKQGNNSLPLYVVCRLESAPFETLVWTLARDRWSWSSLSDFKHSVRDSSVRSSKDASIASARAPLRSEIHKHSPRATWCTKVTKVSESLDSTRPLIWNIHFS